MPPPRPNLWKIHAPSLVRTAWFWCFFVGSRYNSFYIFELLWPFFHKKRTMREGFSKKNKNHKKNTILEQRYFHIFFNLGNFWSFCGVEGGVLGLGFRFRKKCVFTTRNTNFRSGIWCLGVLYICNALDFRADVRRGSWSGPPRRSSRMAQQQKKFQGKSLN